MYLVYNIIPVYIPGMYIYIYIYKYIHIHRVVCLFQDHPVKRHGRDGDQEKVGLVKEKEKLLGISMGPLFQW